MTNENFTINTKYMSRIQLKNVGRLIVKAGELDFPIDNSMVRIGYNLAYGNTFLWCEDVQYTLFISDFDNRIKAMYTCPYDSEETERLAGDDEKKKMNKWAERLQARSARKENA